MKPVEDRIVAIYCLTEDILRGLNHYEDPQCRMTDAEIITTAVTAMMFFGGNFEKARAMLRSPGHSRYDKQKPLLPPPSPDKKPFLCRIRFLFGDTEKTEHGFRLSC